MKKINALFFVLVCSMTLSFASEHTIETPPTMGADNSTTFHKKNITLRPRTPDYTYISCIYGSGYMVLELPLGMDIVYVSILNGTQTIWSGEVTSFDNFVSIPVLQGTYNVVCTAPGDGNYIGEITL